MEKGWTLQDLSFLTQMLLIYKTVKTCFKVHRVLMFFFNLFERESMWEQGKGQRKRENLKQTFLC